MKKIIKLSFITAILAMSFGCSEDILDNSGVSGVSNQTQSITNAQLEQGAFTNLEIPAAFVGGMYSQMIETQTGGTTSHTDFGQKAYDIFADMLCGDMALSASGYGWYRADITEFQAPLDFTRGSNRQVWRYYYRIIRSANNIIQNLGGNDAIPEIDDNKFSMGQAKAMRAHSYFYLTQYYQKEFVGSEAILPMPLEPIGTNLPKSTADEVYTQIEKDLTEAISLLNGFSRSTKNQVNQDIAKAILAYALAAKGGRDGEVATLTQQVISSGNYTMLAESEVVAAPGGINGFNDVNTPSWMWGVDLTPTIGLGLVSWWGQVDSYSYSYAWVGDYKAIDKALYDQIPANDVRKAQFFGNDASGRYLQPLFKFRATDVIGGTSTTTVADYVFMRIEEMYLLNAEANARAGNEGAARTSLKALVSRRVPDASFIDGLSGAQLLNQIYLQTRIELWGEGKSFLAMKRNKATTTRGTNHLSFVGEAIPYNDERMQFEIPLDEIQNNPFLSNQNQ
ncbi:RagB/SusD family nutrient uptake outer membrane protein [Polaribacter vadi]|uniref:Glycan metabolism protein RagB n=1 Tax=Polaribacter vadi TaxID=1774273 RepID=A0A1B8TQX6_9FLAO|nr:RagB/SusD family nutrient uptake outer membrane protein [Polaribacter vadi]AOW18749.1 RagB/SusD family nutrient uptake outer membrane protein [Polaribacter vadi]OBY61888.1 glycan metabolism protein RagB [Polaribacter vadi]